MRTNSHPFSGGDLHTLLRKNGSLDHESTRFVIGSVAAAIWSIHERGFVYADCKPEVSFSMKKCWNDTYIFLKNHTSMQFLSIRTF